MLSTQRQLALAACLLILARFFFASELILLLPGCEHSNSGGDDTRRDLEPLDFGPKTTAARLRRGGDRAESKSH